MIDATGVTTNSITNKIIDTCNDLKLSNGKSILEQFTEDFNGKHNADLYGKTASFEDLFDILEGLLDYQNPDFNDSSAGILSNLKSKYSEIDFATIFELRKRLIKVINGTIAEYDGDLDKKGVWMRDFFHEYINRENILVDVFNLNYDTWIEQILEPFGYEDGFDVIDGYDHFQRFSVGKYLNNVDKHRISHLHGQICFDGPDFRKNDINRFAYEEQEYTLYKYKTYKMAEKHRTISFGADLRTQSGHRIFSTNIVTGRMKTDKVLWSPLQMYMYGFMNALMENDELYIVGYSFGDQYVNHLLFQYLQKHQEGRKVHLIDKKVNTDYEEKTSLFGTPFQDREAVYSQCIMKGERWCRPFSREDRYSSEDKSAEIYIGGFEKYCKEYVGK